MKKLLLLVFGLAVLGAESFAQGHPGKDRRHEQSHKNAPRGNAYGYYKNREVIVNRPSERVIITVRPGIRYVRHYTVAPRSYVYINSYGTSYRSRVLTPQEIDNIAHEMDHARYDQERLEIARAFIRKDMVYAEDVAFLMNYLSFEEHRLELAKFSYRRTVDKQNYHLVFDQLEYRGSKRELDRFIYEY